MLSLSQMSRGLCAPPSTAYQLLVGFEYEVQLFDRSTLRPVTYSGSAGLAEILRFVADMTKGKLVSGDPANKVNLPDGGQISLEPGGQFEFSSAPVQTFAGCLSQLAQFLSLLDEIASRFSLHVFYGGANPLHSLDEIGLVIPNKRYQLMDAYFPKVGSGGRRMMRQTCSLQVTFDYSDERLGLQLLKAAALVTPLAAGLFANAPFIDGRPTGYRSYRVPIWRDTDPSRCGILPGITDPSYSFEDYVAYIIEAPMFFVATPDGLFEAQGMTFAEFNRHGFRGQAASMSDFELHNSTIFTDIRAKRTIEVRTVDAQDPALVPAAIAFLCGLLLCEGARSQTLALLDSFDDKRIETLSWDLAKNGMSGEINGQPTTEVMLKLIELAREGLESCFPDGADAGIYLDRIARLAQSGKTPADVVLEKFSGEPKRWLAAGRTFEGSI